MINSRRWSLTTILALGLMLMVPLAGAAVIDAGTLTSNAPNVQGCGADPNDVTVSLTNSAVVYIKADVSIFENNNLEDRWTTNIAVNWGDWPEEKDVLGNPVEWDGPGDKSHQTLKTDTFGTSDSGGYEEKPGAWSAADFEVDGTYTADVTISIKHEDTPWNDNDWISRCEASGSATVTIHWTGGTGAGGGEEIVIILE